MSIRVNCTNWYHNSKRRPSRQMLSLFSVHDPSYYNKKPPMKQRKTNGNKRRQPVDGNESKQTTKKRNVVPYQDNQTRFPVRMKRPVLPQRMKKQLVGTPEVTVVEQEKDEQPKHDKLNPLMFKSTPSSMKNTREMIIQRKKEQLKNEKIYRRKPPVVQSTNPFEHLMLSVDVKETSQDEEVTRVDTSVIQRQKLLYPETLSDLVGLKAPQVLLTESLSKQVKYLKGSLSKIPTVGSVVFGPAGGGKSSLVRLVAKSLNLKPIVMVLPSSNKNKVTPEQTEILREFERSIMSTTSFLTSSNSMLPIVVLDNVNVPCDVILRGVPGKTIGLRSIIQSVFDRHNHTGKASFIPWIIILGNDSYHGRYSELYHNQVVDKIELGVVKFNDLGFLFKNLDLPTSAISALRSFHSNQRNAYDISRGDVRRYVQQLVMFLLNPSTKLVSNGGNNAILDGKCDLAYLINSNLSNYYLPSIKDVGSIKKMLRMQLGYYNICLWAELLQQNLIYPYIARYDASVVAYDDDSNEYKMIRCKSCNNCAFCSQVCSTKRRKFQKQLTSIVEEKKGIHLNFDAKPPTLHYINNTNVPFSSHSLELHQKDEKCQKCARFVKCNQCSFNYYGAATTKWIE